MQNIIQPTWSCQNAACGCGVNRYSHATAPSTTSLQVQIHTIYLRQLPQSYGTSIACFVLFYCVLTLCYSLTQTHLARPHRLAQHLELPNLLEPRPPKFGQWFTLPSQMNYSLRYQKSRRAAGASSQEVKPNSSRAAGAGGSSNTMLKLYTDDSPGLRVWVLYFTAVVLFIPHAILSRFTLRLCLRVVLYSLGLREIFNSTEIHLSFLSSPSPSSHLSSSCTSLLKSYVRSRSKQASSRGGSTVGRGCHGWIMDPGRMH